MLLTVDVGNSSISCALFKKDKIIFKNVKKTPKKADSKLISLFFPGQWKGKIKDVIISSVVPPLDDSISRTIHKIFHKQAIFIRHDMDLGLKIKIDNPLELGADRIADVVGAVIFFKPPFMVIDSGTATTFDLVNKDYEYIGGAIFPGFQLAVNALAENTAKLPKFKFNPPERIFGANTKDSIQAGVYFSLSGGIQYLIDVYKKVIGKNASVIATGGLSYCFKEMVKNIDLYEPDLIHLGLKYIYERMNGIKKPKNLENPSF